MSCFHVVGLEAASSDKTGFLLQSTCAKASCQSLIFFWITRVTHNVVSFSGFLSDIWFGSFGLGINVLLPGHGGRPQLAGMWLRLFAFLLFSSITLRIRLPLVDAPYKGTRRKTGMGRATCSIASPSTTHLLV